LDTGFVLLVALGFLVGLPPSHAFDISYPRAPATPLEPAAQARRFHSRDLALSLAVQREDAHSSAVERGTSGDDDPQQIADFQGLIAKERFQEVEPPLRAYLAAHPRSWKAYYFLGYVLLGQRKITASVTALAKSLELNTDNADAHRILGRGLTIIGRYEFALREYEQGLRLDPTSAEAHYGMGRIHAIQDDFPNARRELETAIRLDANYMEAYNALGFVMEALGDDTAALADYQTAVRINESRHGKFEGAYVNLAGFYNRQGQLDLAVEYANKALALNPRSHLAYFQIAKTCRAREDWMGVTEASEKAIAINPSRAEYYYVAGVAYRRLGKIQESDSAFASFQHLQKQTGEFERQRRETNRAVRGLEFRLDE
jgi:tetratricopeptide (TPR) repeat protein